jgi:hypothetical protein
MNAAFAPVSAENRANPNIVLYITELSARNTEIAD